jgi:hypothetical protein
MTSVGGNPTDRFQDAKMSVTQCRFCDHVNPAGSKFCSECGGALHLLPCPRCGAVSEVTATLCYQCQAKLPWHTAGIPVGAAPSGVAAKASIPWRSPAIVTAAVVAAVSILGYYAYRQLSLADTPQLPAAGSAASGSAVRIDDIAKSEPVTDTSDPAPESIEDSSAVQPAASATKPRRSRQTAQSFGATAAVEPPERSATVSAGKITPRTPSDLEACTESAAALGLCTLQPGQAKKGETGAIKAEAPPVPTFDATSTGGEQSSSGKPCPEAQVALGLCTQRNSQGGN